MRRLSRKLARTNAMIEWAIEDYVSDGRRKLNRAFKGVHSDAQREALYQNRSR